MEISSRDRMRVICLVESNLGGAGVNDEAAIFRMHSKCCKIYSDHMKTAMGMMATNGGGVDSDEKVNADRLAMAAVKKYLVGKKRGEGVNQEEEKRSDANNDIDLFITQQMLAHKAARISMKQ